MCITLADSIWVFSHIMLSNDRFTHVTWLNSYSTTHMVFVYICVCMTSDFRSIQTTDFSCVTWLNSYSIAHMLCYQTIDSHMRHESIRILLRAFTKMVFEYIWVCMTTDFPSTQTTDLYAWHESIRILSRTFTHMVFSYIRECVTSESSSSQTTCSHVWQDSSPGDQATIRYVAWRESQSWRFYITL